ncbi:hypothetical protein NW752_001779 [Fusarium irregulare]|uniref:Trichothecene 3-O-acetyltransferase n=1 Tax=Fusarium irregulare TaxID=2494466 RepID=A0A9W8PVG6_9HYPO|nr:hypothetical protein NW766_003945 [Fusarium irregulare]KAJ4026823.1 hypothetical protein NW752_001779 [Fusarium irregulare]
MAAVPTEVLVVDQTHGIPTKTAVTEQVNEVLDLAPPLLPTEKIGPMGWVRLVFHFELPENYDSEELTSIFKKAYSSFKERVPIAGCEAVPTPTYLEDGLLQLRHYGDEIEHDFKVKDLRNEDFPSFQELKSQGFPASALDPDVVCQRGLGGEWPAAGVDRLNTTMMQVNFIKGGLLLNMLFLHAFIDGACMYKFTELLAEDVRKAQGLAIFEPAEIPVADRAKIAKSSGAKPGKAEDHAEYLEVPFTPTGPPEKLASPVAHGHVFYFSPEKIQALKELASPSNAKLFKSNKDKSPYISTNDALTALVWRCTMMAQHKHKQGEDKSTGPSMLGLALDARRRYTGQDVHKHTIGNILGFAPTIMDIQTLINEEEATLADVALVVRATVNKSKDSYLDSITARVEQLNNVSRLVPTIFLDMPGNHALLSSWREFPFYDIKWGAALGDRMQALRPPKVGITHAMHVLLPHRPEAGPGIEVFVNTENSAMEGLMDDPLWRQYAEGPMRV